MKHTGFKIFCLIIWACITVFSVSGHNTTFRTYNWETKILESFNGDDDAPYVWKTECSRYITKDFPRLAFINARPDQGSIRALANTGVEVKSLGIHGAFDRKGYNWIDLYPTLADDSDEKPYEIPMSGTVHQLDLWVWGSNLNYYIEAYVRDYRGVVHVIKLGNIGYMGWRNLRTSVPAIIPQERRILPSNAELHFVKFRIWTYPTERVDNFYIYFKQFRLLSDMFNELYDGYDLGDPGYVDSLWNK